LDGLRVVHTGDIQRKANRLAKQAQDNSKRQIRNARKRESRAVQKADLGSSQSSLLWQECWRVDSVVNEFLVEQFTWIFEGFASDLDFYTLSARFSEC
jgi:hypothetical protein